MKRIASLALLLALALAGCAGNVGGNVPAGANSNIGIQSVNRTPTATPERSAPAPTETPTEEPAAPEGAGDDLSATIVAQQTTISAQATQIAVLEGDLQECRDSCLIPTETPAPAATQPPAPTQTATMIPAPTSTPTGTPVPATATPGTSGGQCPTEAPAETLQKIHDMFVEHMKSYPGDKASFETRYQWLQQYVEQVQNLPGAQTFNKGPVEFCGGVIVIGQFPSNNAGKRPSCEDGLLPIGALNVQFAPHNDPEYGFYVASGKLNMTNGGIMFGLLPEAANNAIMKALADGPVTDKAEFDTLVLDIDNAVAAGANRFDARKVYFGLGSVNWTGYDPAVYKPSCNYIFRRDLSIPGHAGIAIGWGDSPAFAFPAASYPNWEAIAK